MDEELDLARQHVLLEVVGPQALADVRSALLLGELKEGCLLISIGDSTAGSNSKGGRKVYRILQLANNGVCLGDGKVRFAAAYHDIGAVMRRGMVHGATGQGAHRCAACSH